jgi:hypothetical protein
MRKIILDTNFLLIPAQFKIDIFSEIKNICDFSYNLYVLDKTVDELNKIIKEQTGKNKAAAKLALDIIKVKKLKKIKTEEGNVDDLLLEQDAIIATQDKLLIKRLKTKKKKVIQLRQKKYLIIK